ncbi:MAG: DNA adenine methylase, partial [Deltaproteobacteria bacterium]|nr:DNA adenine methylase [Deltaproteobacteria bacterium]
SAQKDLILTPAEYEITDNKNQVFYTDGNLLIKRIKGYILYLDPPYNARQYGANYHILNTIAKYHSFIPKGKTGLPNYKKSKYCSKNLVKKEFEELIKNANFKYIFLSYNNEGLMSGKYIKNIMSKYGKFSSASVNYQRFKADKDKNRKHIANNTKEYLYILEKI